MTPLDLIILFIFCLFLNAMTLFCFIMLFDFRDFSCNLCFVSTLKEKSWVGWQIFNHLIDGGAKW